MTLSVACCTRDPGPQVAAALEQLEPVADEIVIAADSRVDAATLSQYATVADRLLRYEFTGSNRCFSWLMRQCGGDWALLIAGDEVASPELVELLPELMAARDALQYWLPERWLYPDPGHWLDELPWAPDFHNRLVRNDGTLHYTGEKHTGADPVFPARYLRTGTDLPPQPARDERAGAPGQGRKLRRREGRNDRPHWPATERGPVCPEDASTNT